MRAPLLVALAGVAFAAFVVVTHQRAGAVIERERRALVRVRHLARGGPGPASEAGGYRFAWRTGGSLPDVLVARPLRHATDGNRWFVATPDHRVYEYDTVVYKARDDRPAIDILRRHVENTPPDAAQARLPFGWRRLPWPGADPD